MGTREVLSLQFGHYSNFIGTHWWNIQELGFSYNSSEPSEINHDVLYREGSTSRGQVTYTPRMLLVDLKGSLKAFSEDGGLYEPPTDPKKVETFWDTNSIETKIESKHPKNSFQEDLENLTKSPDALSKSYNLEDDVKVWCDFLYTRFHPRTINVIKEYEHESKLSQFDVYPVGSNLWKTEQFTEDFSDKIRSYIEECDSFQGFHVTLDATNAFSGLASSCIQSLNDEYCGKSVLAFPVIPAYYSDYLINNDEEKHQSIIKDSTRVLNLAMCFNALSEHTSLFVPLCTSKNGWRQPGPPREFYHLSYNNQLHYHTSAILASALDTMTLKHRLRSTGFSLSDLCADLNEHGRKGAAASLCLPFSIAKGEDLIDCLDKWEGPLSQSISPNCSIGTERMLQMVTIRGVPENRLKRPPQLAKQQADMPAYRCNSVQEMLSMYLSCTCYGSASNVTSVSKGLAVKTPYPRLFDQRLDSYGNIIADPRMVDIDIETVPVLAGLHTGESVGDMFESLHTEAKKVKFRRFHQFINAGLESDEFTECLDRLFDLRECYVDDYGL